MLIYGTQGLKAGFTADEVRLFMLQFPCSGLQPDRAYWFEFGSNGELVDTDVPEHSDGAGASALAEDAKAFLFEDKLPDWL